MLSVKVIPETQLDKPQDDDGFELVVNRKQRRINRNNRKWENFKQMEFKTLTSTSDNDTGKLFYIILNNF